MHPSVTFGDTSPCRGGFIKCLPPGRLPCKGSWRRQPTEGCGALSCQYPSGPPQGSPAGDLARRMGFAASQGLRDDASIVPYETQGRVLPGFAGYLWGKAAMHPSVTFGDTSPCRGGFIKCLPPGRLPCKGSWRRQPTEGCGALPCQYPSGLAPPGGRERPPYNARQTGGGTGNSRHGGWMTVVERRLSAQGPMQASSPTKHRAGFCRSLQEAALKGKLTPLPLRAAFCAAALFAGRRFVRVYQAKPRRF